jgi:putative transposase
VIQLVRSIKAKTSRELITEFKALGLIFPGSQVWAGGYFAASFGEVTNEVITKWVEEQSLEPPDGDFKIADDF